MTGQRLKKTKTSKPATKNSFETWRIASPLTRITAQVIDQCVVGVATAIAMAWWFPHDLKTRRWVTTFALLWILVSWLMQTVFAWMYKNTLGRHLMGLKLVNTSPRKQMGFSQLLVRSFVWWLGGLTLGAGWSTILSRPDRRAWHDIAAQTVVVSEKGEFTRASKFEQTLGDGWLAFLSVTFNIVVASLMLFEMGKLGKVIAFFSPDQGHVIERWQKVADLDFNSMHANDSLNREPSSLESRPLQILSALNKMGPTRTQAEFLRSEMAQTENNSPDHYALATAIAHIYMKVGAFNDAVQFLAPEVRKLQSGDELARDIAFGSDGQKIFVDEMREAYFQAQALNMVPVDSKDVYFTQWASGLTKKQVSQCSTSAEALAFWWKTLSTNTKDTNYSPTPDLTAWEKTKAQFHFDGSDFEKQVSAAIDFVVTVKQAVPDSLVEKSNAVGINNLVWGWAQGQALKRYGSQWVGVVRPAEADMITKYDLVNENPSTGSFRTIASIRKRSIIAKPRQPGHEILKRLSDSE